MKVSRKKVSKIQALAVLIRTCVLKILSYKDCYEGRKIYMFMYRLVRCIKRIYHRFREDEVPAVGAQLAYYLILAFFPFVIFLITLVGYSPISSDQVLNSLSQILPLEAYNIIDKTISEVVNVRSRRLLSFSFISTLWAASNGVGALINGLNRAYDEKESRPFWKVKGIALIFTLILSMGILFAFIMLVFGGVIERKIISILGSSVTFKFLWNVLRYIFVLAFLFIVFSALYYYIPNCRLKLREVLPGAAFSTLGWLAASMAFAFYVDNFARFSVIYGSIGGVMILLIWLYISAVIILIGGELNAALAFDKQEEEEHR